LKKPTGKRKERDWAFFFFFVSGWKKNIQSGYGKEKCVFLTNKKRTRAGWPRTSHERAMARTREMEKEKNEGWLAMNEP